MLPTSSDKVTSFFPCGYLYPFLSSCGASVCLSLGWDSFFNAWTLGSYFSVGGKDRNEQEWAGEMVQPLESGLTTKNIRNEEEAFSQVPGKG